MSDIAAGIKRAAADLYMARSNFEDEMGKETLSEDARQAVQSFLGAIDEALVRLESLGRAARRDG
jgi:hypothetical protein